MCATLEGMPRAALRTRLVHIRGLSVIGIPARTCWNWERDDTSSRVARLWQTFDSEGGGEQILQTMSRLPVLVATDYDSDYRGNFTVILGCEVRSDATCPPNYRHVTVASGAYVACGPLDAGAQGIDARAGLGDVLEASCGATRVYDSDFERYEQGRSMVTLYLGIDTHDRAIIERELATFNRTQRAA